MGHYNEIYEVDCCGIKWLESRGGRCYVAFRSPSVDFFIDSSILNSTFDLPKMISDILCLNRRKHHLLFIQNFMRRPSCLSVVVQFGEECSTFSSKRGSLLSPLSVSFAMLQSERATPNHSFLKGFRLVHFSVCEFLWSPQSASWSSYEQTCRVIRVIVILCITTWFFFSWTNQVVVSNFLIIDDNKHGTNYHSYNRQLERSNMFSGKCFD